MCVGISTAVMYMCAVCTCMCSVYVQCVCAVCICIDYNNSCVIISLYT